MEIDEKIVEKIRSAKIAFALTGAGSSAPSGIPTFRGKDGFWKDKSPFSLDTFNRDPQAVWGWHQEIKEMIREKSPNPSHFALAKIQELFDDFAVVTQNIDNLHQEAGSEKVIELHGNIYRNKCNSCGEIFGDVDSKTIPKCDKCGGYIRPDVVWFGEPLPHDSLLKAREYAENSEICFVVGTSGVVQPAASIPLISRENGAYVIEINLEETVISKHLDLSFFGDASKILPGLWERLT